jgi:hypothetical protein
MQNMCSAYLFRLAPYMRLFALYKDTRFHHYKWPCTIKQRKGAKKLFHELPSG